MQHRCTHTEVNLALLEALNGHTVDAVHVEDLGKRRWREDDMRRSRCASFCAEQGL